MVELYNKLSVLTQLNPIRFVIDKSSCYYCVERNEKLQSYHVVLRLNDNLSILFTIMVGNEVYVDEVICDIIQNNEKIYSGNLSIENLIKKVENIKNETIGCNIPTDLTLKREIENGN